MGETILENEGNAFINFAGERDVYLGSGTLQFDV